MTGKSYTRTVAKFINQVLANAQSPSRGGNPPLEHFAQTLVRPALFFSAVSRLTAVGVGASPPDSPLVTLMLVHSWYDDKCCHDKDCRMKILANTVRAPDGAIASPSACAGTALSPSFPRAVSAHHAAGASKSQQMD